MIWMVSGIFPHPPVVIVRQFLMHRPCALSAPRHVEAVVQQLSRHTTPHSWSGGLSDISFAECCPKDQRDQKLGTDRLQKFERIGYMEDRLTHMLGGHFLLIPFRLQIMFLPIPIHILQVLTNHLAITPKDSLNKQPVYRMFLFWPYIYNIHLNK